LPGTQGRCLGGRGHRRHFYLRLPLPLAVAVADALLLRLPSSSNGLATTNSQIPSPEALFGRFRPISSLTAFLHAGTFLLQGSFNK
jgi:hypothetical protein